MKIKVKCKNYEYGDIRVVRKFLFIPLCINSTFRWLEYVEFEEKCLSNLASGTTLEKLRWVDIDG